MSTIAAPAETRGDISRQWIMVHLLGGIPFNAVYAVAPETIAWTGITPGNLSPTELVLLAVGFVGVYSPSLIFLGYLSGGVLRRKFPLFPRRAWVVLFGFCGILIGLLSLIPWLDEWPDRASTRFDDSLVWLVAVTLVMIAGAVFGALQAFVLRNTAVGLRTWVLYSALAALPIFVAVPSFIYSPASGLASDMLDALAGLVATVAGAVIMLPALHRLRPRTLMA